MRTVPTPVSPQLIFGLFVMALGIILGLDSLGIADAGFVIRFWPLGIMMLGATIASRAEQHSRFWGFFWMFVGGWLLFRNLGIVRVGFWQLVWPAVLLWLGGSVVLKTLQQTGHLKVENKGGERLFAIRVA